MLIVLVIVQVRFFQSFWPMKQGALCRTPVPRPTLPAATHPRKKRTGATPNIHMSTHVYIHMCTPCKQFIFLCTFRAGRLRQSNLLSSVCSSHVSVLHQRTKTIVWGRALVLSLCLFSVWARAPKACGVMSLAARSNCQICCHPLACEVK